MADTEGAYYRPDTILRTLYGLSKLIFIKMT